MTDPPISRIENEITQELPTEVANRFRHLFRENVETLTEEEVDLIRSFRSWQSTHEAASGVFHYKRRK